MEERSRVARTTEHPSISRGTVLLSIIDHDGTQQCVEYVIEAPVTPLWQSTQLRLLGVLFAFLSLSIHNAHFIGIIITASASIFLIYRLFWQIKKETLLVVSSVGVQFTSIFRSGLQTSCFIPWHSIRDILIIEAFSLQRVLYNLVVLVETSGSDSGHQIKQKLIPLFQNTRPRLSCLECIYQSLNSHIQWTFPKKD